jgi:hypothetical protein
VRFSQTTIALLPRGAVRQVQIWVENHGRSEVVFNHANLSIGVKGSEEKLTLIGPTTDARFPVSLKPGGSFYVMRDKLELVKGLADMKGTPDVQKAPLPGPLNAVNP